MTNQTTTITTEFVRNEATARSITKTVPLVVVNNSLVPDFRNVNPGVVQGNVSSSVLTNTDPLQTAQQYS